MSAESTERDPAMLAAELAAAKSEIARLSEKLDVLQSFTRSGFFEREFPDMGGHWDRTMYEIWGRDGDGSGKAPAYDSTLSQVIWTEQNRTLPHTLHSFGPHAQHVRIRRPDGRERLISTQWRVLHDAAGQPRRAVGINTDITEIHELANRAAELRTELDVALTLGGIGLWRQELTTMRVWPDRRGCEILGVPWHPEGMTVEEARARIHPDDVAQAEASAQHTLRTGEVSDMQLRYARAGGGWRHVMLRRALHHDAAGRALGFVGVMIDVSVRVETQARLEDAARRLDMAADAARVGLWSARSDAPLPEWNRRMFDLLGLDPAAGALPLKQAIERVVHPDDRARVAEESRHFWRSTAGMHEMEFRIVRPSDGALRWIVLRGSVEAATASSPQRAEGVALDTTEHQLALRRLRETVERMSLTTRALGLGTWRSDAERQHVVWDEQMFELRGRPSPARELSPAERQSYVHPDDLAGVSERQNDAVRDGETWRDVFRVVWPDGQVRWISSHSVPLLDEQGRIEGHIGLNWDCTELQLAAQARRERELVVAENVAKTQTLSRISHELRTPLNAILGFTQLLRAPQPAGRGAADTDRRDHWLHLVEDAAQHLLALIDDVLDLTRAQLGELKLDPMAVPCDQAVDSAIALVAGDAAAAEVFLRREATAGSVRADPVRLRQVLLNLLSNAIKYNRRGGEVLISAARSGGRVRLCVSDNGDGIAPELLRAAFEPFNRLGAERSTVPGSGLGLAVVKALVEAMGGTVEASSVVGQGSTFCIELPAADASAAGLDPAAGPVSEVETTTPLPPHPAAAEPVHRLLYIEDNEVNALLVREMLASRPGLELHVAADGASGIDAARRLQPALVLVDMRLPDMDGLDVLRRLRADPATAALRCVALSANATQADIDTARATGFAEYWTKPIEWRVLLEGVQRQLDARG
jgi:PAS domain S-box-containing protein